MKAKKSTRSLTIEIEPEQYDAVKKFADDQERSMSYVARKALKAFLPPMHSGIEDRGSGGVNSLTDSTRSPKGG
jgi:hypothetical protein